VGARTVTGTKVLVVVLPAESRAVAVRVWPPTVLSCIPEVEYGGSITSDAERGAVEEDWAPATRMSSDAEAVTVMMLVTESFGYRLRKLNARRRGVDRKKAALNAAICMTSSRLADRGAVAL